MRSGVRIEELQIGAGPEATCDSRVRVRYEGYLNQGERFQSAIEGTLDLWRRDVVAGLRYGLEGMRPGGRRRIRVAPHLAYRDVGVPGIIPPNAVLIFEVELLEVTPNPCREEI